MDQFDLEQELNARYRQQPIPTWQKEIGSHRAESRRYFEECKEQIPEKRRLAVPGCR